ncbi:pilus assembly protein [Pseudomonas sp. V1]|uniref:type II secretion system protein GspD n=1 Tax=Pseudomonas arcuscaelestis TaxID=2710591 RepID=UPI00193F8917|nr:pilus assembly protein [Pseudomonas arcuscaelestis]MBM3105718.1 pilus assembly protein [Pseudomonas arcuscaelestis]
MKMKSLALALLVATGMMGCTSSFDISEEAQNAPLRPEAKDALQAARGNTFVREIRSEDVAMTRPVFLTVQSKPLRSVLQETLPGYAIIPKGKVNLNDPIDVASAGMTLADFIEYIEGTRDLNIELSGKRVIVSDFETREWNLATFASTRNVNNVIASTQTRGAKAGEDDSNSQGDSSTATGTSIGLQLSEDEWAKIMEGARTIIGAESSDSSSNQSMQGGASSASVGSSGNSNNGMTGGLNFDAPSPTDFGLLTSSDEISPYIEGIRSVGILTAGGKPSKMKVLDRYLKRAISEATKVVNVQVEAYDVILNNDKQKGIDWNLIVQGSVNGNPLGLAFFNTQTASTDPFWNISGTFESDHVKGDVLLRFLENYGRVELTDQPNITVRNGVPAQIYAGEELTYIVDVEQSQDESGNVTVTPKLGRLKVGVTLSVTVRVLDNDQLLVDIWPVISNLSGNDTISIGDFEFETPRVNLKEFSTQLITSSGRAVHLGGLITKKMNQALRHLPWQNLVTKAVLNPLTQDVNNQLDRRELVLVVTPTLVEGAL